MKGRLVKWDAEMLPDPENPPDLEDPTKHPACLEVVEMNEGKDPETTYRREEPCR